MTPTQRFVPEPLRATVVRNVLLATLISTAVAMSSARSAHPIRWPVALVLMLWPTFGGHVLEVWFLQWLKPRLPEAPIVQGLARLAAWFIGGCVLGLAIALTGRALGIDVARWPAWWVAGVAFIGIELVAHGGLQARRRPSFFNGRG